MADPSLTVRSKGTLALDNEHPRIDGPSNGFIFSAKLPVTVAVKEVP